jgi:hypothetical protein
MAERFGAAMVAEEPFAVRPVMVRFVDGSMLLIGELLDP